MFGGETGKRWWSAKKYKVETYVCKYVFLAKKKKML